MDEESIFEAGRAIDACMIDLWFAFSHEIHDPALMQAYQALLSAEEATRWKRFRFAVDQHTYLVARALVRTVLSRYAEVEPAEWRFRTNVFGRPEIAQEREDLRSIRFNLSHTTGLVMVGITNHRELGVDTEDTAAPRVSLDLIEQFMTESEIKSLRKEHEQDQATRLFEYWTLKEAYIKARGMGLSLPLKGLSLQFTLDQGLKAFCTPDFDDDIQRWRFLLLQASGHHVASVCFEQNTDAEQQTHAYKTVPLAGVEVFQPVILRDSANTKIK
jgi:4'-phosphopantetheinyl transferase